MLRLILLILFVIVVLAVTFLPWWGLLILGASVILLSKFFAKRVVLWLFSIPFRAKGKVLRGAAVEIHNVRPTAPPSAKFSAPKLGVAEERGHVQDGDQADGDEPEDESPDEPDVPRDYFEIDVTITPRTPTGPFTHWEFAELTLVKPGKRWDQDDDTCSVKSVNLVREGVTLLDRSEPNDPNDEEADEGGKVPGPQRLRMVIGVKAGVRELAFNYYFESFGKLQLPAATVPRS